MFVKVHKVLQKGFSEVVVALCDESVLGETLGEGFVVNPSFYKGERVTPEVCAEFLKNASVINAVGRNSVKLLVDKGYISESDAVLVGGVPHAQVFTVDGE